MSGNALWMKLKKKGNHDKNSWIQVREIIAQEKLGYLHSIVRPARLLDGHYNPGAI